MSFEFPNVESRPSRILTKFQHRWVGVMESGARKATLVEGKPREYKPTARANSRKSFPSGFFGIESLLVLLCLTALLLLLPLILPPLPPPPFMLLLLPIGIFAVLLILAFMPYDVRDIASSYV